MFYDNKVALQIVKTAFRPSTFSFWALFWSLSTLVSFAVFNAALRVLQALDYVFFPGLRKTKVEAPVFVLANPRSGTTFLHRLMAMDVERFTYMRLWQTIFPSVIAYRTIVFIGRADRLLGRPMGRLLGLVERLMFKGWDGVHRVGFNHAEEEEMIFLTTLVDPPIHLVIPHPKEYKKHIVLDNLSPARRAPIMRKYERALRAHIYATGNNRVLLSKNVFHSGRLDSILETFPDARFVHLVRHPYSSLASTISMLTGPWSFFMPSIPKDSPEYRYWAELGMDAYARVHRQEPALKERGVNFVTFTYDELIGDPKATVESIYDSLGIEMTPAFSRQLVEETTKARRYRSTHEYNLSEYGLAPEDIYARIPEIFEAYGFEKHPSAEPANGGIDAAVSQVDAKATSRPVVEQLGASAVGGDMQAIPSTS
jgi:hypothetical protein